MGLVSLCALVASISCGKSSKSKEAGAGSAAPPAVATDVKLVVLIVIDQLPSWTFTRDAGQLDGGIGRLLRESVYFPEVTVPYANTYTAPGHATIATGAGPNKSGVLANGWLRSTKGDYLPATSDPTYPLYDMTEVSTGGPVKRIAALGASPITLRLDGVADVLAREKPNARSVAVGLKQRAAILMLGKKPTRAVWYESAQQAMTTSAFYGDPPEWLLEFNKKSTAISRYKETWQVQDPDFLRRYTGVVDEAEGEGAGMGLSRSFPHTIERSPAASKAFRMMPGSVGYLLDTARAAIDGEQLGQRGERDLLAITISTHDYVGHFWGQESWERFDMIRQIDKQLGTFFTELDATLGKGGYSVVFTSDHGVVPLVELSRAAGRVARRVLLPELTGAMTKGLESVLGKGEWVAGYGANSVYVSDAFRKKSPAKQTRALNAAVAELQKIPNVELAQLTSELTGNCARHKDELRRVICESLHPEESGQITAVSDRYSLFQSPGYTTGTSHGGPSIECRQVPVIVHVPGAPVHQSTKRVTTYQIAPTLSQLLDISAPRTDGPKALPLEPDPNDTHSSPAP